MKLRYHMETMGFIACFAFTFMMWVTTVFQWYAPNHEIIMCWNEFGEAFVEYFFALIMLPCILYFFKVSALRLIERRRK